MSYLCDIPKNFCNLRDKDGSCRIERPCLPIVDQCKGCEKIENGYCKVYISPTAKWSNGKVCPIASIAKEEAEHNKVRIGQQKQKKNKI